MTQQCGNITGEPSSNRPSQNEPRRRQSAHFFSRGFHFGDNCLIFCILGTDALIMSLENVTTANVPAPRCLLKQMAVKSADPPPAILTFRWRPARFSWGSVRHRDF
jgi:hypothetical protein